MALTAIFGKKIDQTQAFLEDGRRIPLSLISVTGNVVTQIKDTEKDTYSALQIGFGSKKKANKATAGHIKKAGLTTTPRFFREIRTDDTAGFELGQVLNIEEILEPGDIINVTGTSKGKGYAGVVKRHHFKGGPRTHGQSDRERAPGSSGQTTTPGRVYKGKRMSGRMGDEQVTVRNLTVVDIKDGVVYVKGLIPGIKGALVVISKVGKAKNFMPLFSVKVEEVEPVVEQVEVEALPEEPEEAAETQEGVQENETVEPAAAEPVSTESSGEPKEEAKAEEVKTEEVKEEETKEDKA
ncbi:MAG: 50S ribosomal protein L3 [Candidatus Levyibacteriota bacterium]